MPSDFSSWQAWAAVAAGFLSVAVVAMVGGLLSRRRRPEFGQAAVRSFLHGSVVDRRQSVRRKGNRVALAVTDPRTPGEPAEGWVLDRSEGGLGILVDDAVAVGTVLGVRVVSSAATVPPIRVEVRTCRQVVGGWALGCRFLDQVPLHLLLLFG